MVTQIIPWLIVSLILGAMFCGQVQAGELGEPVEPFGLAARHAQRRVEIRHVAADLHDPTAGIVYVVPSSGGEAKALTAELEATAGSLAWSADSRTIYANAGDLAADRPGGKCRADLELHPVTILGIDGQFLPVVRLRAKIGPGQQIVGSTAQGGAAVGRCERLPVGTVPVAHLYRATHTRR